MSTPVLGGETFRDMLVRALRGAAAYNPQTEVPSVALFWPDEGSEWAPLLPTLRQRVPIYALGPYDVAALSGPPLWLRCVVERAVPEAPATGTVPILYLPGVPPRALLQLAIAMTITRVNLMPLIGIRSRAVTWTQPDGHAWRVASFISDTTEGPGVPIRSDDATQRALLRALPLVADLTVARLRADAPWRAADFDALAGLVATSHEPAVTDLVARGESATLEFKSSIRWDIKLARENKELELPIVKTVAAFLNSTGGTLLIGVADDGEILGLERDQLTIGKQPRDRDQVERHLNQLFQNHFGAALIPYIRIRFHDVDGKDVCRISASPAPDPAYVMKDKKGSDVEFYVRAGNASVSLGVRDAISYIRTHRLERG